MQGSLIDDRAATRGRHRGNAGRTVGDQDGQRCDRCIAVAVGQPVGEDIHAAARRSAVAGIGIAAVGSQGQRAELAGDGRAGVGEIARGAGAEAVYRSAIGTQCIGTGAATGRADAGNDIAAFGEAVVWHRVGIVARGRHIVDDADGNRACDRIAVGIERGVAEGFNAIDRLRAIVGGRIGGERLGQCVGVGAIGIELEQAIGCRDGLRRIGGRPGDSELSGYCLGSR